MQDQLGIDKTDINFFISAELFEDDKLFFLNSIAALWQCFRPKGGRREAKTFAKKILLIII